jgi:3-deoxy-7-phosphoheptulonate synthase / chorismate mutase
VSEPDPAVRRLRERITETDHALLAATNARLELVAELRRYKEEHGIDFLDPDRERWMLDDLRAANGGPLSDDGVRELLEFLLDLTKREVAREG